MTPEKITVETRVTRKRELVLSSDQVLNIVKRWAIRNHGFSDAASVEEQVSFDGMLSGVTITETQVEVETDEDGPRP